MFGPVGSFTGHKGQTRKFNEIYTVMIEYIHFYVCCFGFLFIATVIHLTLLEDVSEVIPGTSQQYIRNIRNILINVAFFSFIGKAFGILLETYLRFVFEIKALDNAYFDLLWVIVSIVVWLVWRQKLVFTPPTNSILRVTNRFYTGKRDLPDNQGHVDNAIKYRGPIYAVISIFDNAEQYVETESRANLKVKIPNLRFKYNSGSCFLTTSFTITDPDAYAANGDTDVLRFDKVKETVLSRLKSMVEAITRNQKIEDVQSNPGKYFGSLSNEFKRKNKTLEARLGINIQFVEISDIDESDAYKDVVDAIGVNMALTKQANEMVKAARRRGDNDLSFETALQIASGNAGKAKYTVIHAKGLGKGTIVDADGNVTGHQN